MYIKSGGGAPGEEPFVVPTWADGTDEEIVAALEAHYNDEIDLTEYWTVGDERVVHLDAMSATGVPEAHNAQDVSFVLLNQGGAELVSPINGHNECVFIVGQKDCLLETGKMNASSNVRGWDYQDRYFWCSVHYIYSNAIPSTFKNIFKDHYYWSCYDTTSITSSKMHSVFSFAKP